jgi:hypothetical protein
VTPSIILDRLAAAGVRVRLDPQNPDRLRLSPPDRLTADLLALARDHKRELLTVLRERAKEPTYTRCLDCTRYTAPKPDTAFWCPLVRAHPIAALWAICTGYTAKPGTPPGPTVPPEQEVAR